MSPVATGNPRPTRFSGFRPAILLLLAAGALWLWQRQGSSGPKQGGIAPGFELRDLNHSDTLVRSQDLRGQAVLIEVFASWCSACRAQASTLHSLTDSLSTHHVRLLGVSVDESDGLARQAAQLWGFTGQLTRDDGSFSKSFNISLLPTLILLDRAGRVVHTSTGVTGRATLEAWLQALPSG